MDFMYFIFKYDFDAQLLLYSSLATFETSNCVPLMTRGAVTGSAGHAMAYPDFSKLLHKNAIKSKFRDLRGQILGIIWDLAYPDFFCSRRP